MCGRKDRGWKQVLVAVGLLLLGPIVALLVFLGMAFGQGSGQ